MPYIWDFYVKKKNIHDGAYVHQYAESACWFKKFVSSGDFQSEGAFTNIPLSRYSTDVKHVLMPVTTFLLCTRLSCAACQYVAEQLLV